MKLPEELTNWQECKAEILMPILAIILLHLYWTIRSDSLSISSSISANIYPQLASSTPEVQWSQTLLHIPPFPFHSLSLLTQARANGAMFSITKGHE
jgi:hypothetical protein